MPYLGIGYLRSVKLKNAAWSTDILVLKGFLPGYIVNQGLLGALITNLLIGY